MAKFMEVAHATGIEFGSCMSFYAKPSRLATSVMSASKMLAKALVKHKLVPGHRQALEHIAKAAGYADYHALQTLCKNTEGAHGGNFAVLDAFVPALPLLLSVHPKDIPSDRQQATWLRFATELGKRISAVPLPVLDCIAELFNEPSWQSLCQRPLLSTAEPMYSFSVSQFMFEPKAKGAFYLAPGVLDLIEELTDAVAGYDEMLEAEQMEVKTYLLQLLKRRPDFMDARLVLADIVDRDNLTDSSQKTGFDPMPLYLSVIGQAEALIPDDFNGTIDWSGGFNRFYLQALNGAMRGAALGGDLTMAINLAKKQLRLNPEDNQGVRFDLPALQAAAGDEGAHAAIKRAAKGTASDDGHLAFLRSLVNCALGQDTEGIRYFGRALLFMPALRQFLLEEEMPSVQDEVWRHYIPDLAGLWFQLAVIEANALPWDEMPYGYLLERPVLIDLEARARVAYDRHRENWAAWVAAEVDKVLPQLIEP